MSEYAVPPRQGPVLTPWKQPRVLLFLGRSGGSCKTTHSTIMATLLSQLGYRVLYIELDSQANGSKRFGYPAATYHGPGILDVIESATRLRREKLRLVDVVRPALYRDVNEPGAPYKVIENLWIAPASTDLKESDRILVLTEQDGAMSWFEDLVAEQLGDLDVDVVLVDLPASEGMTVVSAMRGAVEAIGCMGPDDKGYDGLIVGEQTIQHVVQKTGSPLQMVAVVIGNYENAHTGGPKIRFNRDYTEKARQRWGDRVLHVVRKSKSRLGESESWSCALPFFAPDEPILADYRIVLQQLGFLPLEGLTIPEQAKAVEDAIAMVKPNA
jgi:cellulose biosynthesis protein BcsQ